jgi:hypothetical protein
MQKCRNKKDITRPNAYANFFNKKEKAKSEYKNEEPDDEGRRKFLKIVRENSSSEAARHYCGKKSF